MKWLCFNLVLVIMTTNHIWGTVIGKTTLATKHRRYWKCGRVHLRHEVSFNSVVQEAIEAMLTYNKCESSRLRPREAIHYESVCLHHGDWIDTAFKLGAGNKARRYKRLYGVLVLKVYHQSA
jgi:hypothetical protein